MFKEAIEKVAHFTRPVHTIIRTYGGKKIIPGAATFFFVNEEGYAITCKHVVELLASSDHININYAKFKQERDRLTKDHNYKKNLKGLELKYKLNSESVIQIKNTFLDCVDTMSGFTWLLHPVYDLAILKLNGFTKLHYKDFAQFKKGPAQIYQGEFLCRLGFPFPEFTNFNYNETADDIEWNSNGIVGSPRFPIEGMVTRFLAEDNKLYGIELSTPGLKGQSGGPLFNKEGIVCGMQFSTKHLHLGFDIEEKEITVNNQLKTISDYSFIHLGQCIHSDIIKEFLVENKVKFYEED